MELTMIFVIIYLMLFHWIGDFVFQSRYMAETKHQLFSSLFLHTAIYSLVMAVGMWSLVPILYIVTMYVINFTFWKLLLSTFLIFVFHSLTDSVTSGMTKKFHSYGQTKKFFTTIGFDQWFHLIQILVIYWTIFV
jgi:hypothetical protein